MSRPKKGQLAQFMIPVRQSSDGSVASTVTVSDFNSGAVVKFFGANHGGSAATTSGIVSKIASLVKSGVFRITLKGTENNYDEMMLRINKTALKETIVAWNNDTKTTSDIISRLSDIGSDLRSFLVVMSGVQSDIYSSLSDLQSDFQSRVPKAVATNSQLSDLHSDLRSVAILAQSVLSDVYSSLSDLQSDFQSRVPKRVATDSQLSDMASDLKSVMTIVQSMASDAASAAQQGNSRVLLCQSRISDAQSFLSDFQSDLLSHLDTTGVGLNASTMSDLRSAINALTVTIGPSDISDIASAVVAGLPVVSMVSDIYSMLSDFMSDFQSRVPKRVATDSQLSDMASDIKSAVVVTQSMASDAASAAQQANSRVLLNQSRISDVYSMLSDLQSDFQSRVPKAVATNSQLSDLASDLRSYLAGMSGVQSDIYSALIAGPEIGASSMSDIRSAITANGVTRAGADPTGVVGVTATLADKVDWLTAMSRNKLTQTSTSAVLFNDASVAVASATVADDGTTFTRSEWH
jgi:uncharacterized protein YeeX (DUF496 family)